MSHALAARPALALAAFLFALPAAERADRPQARLDHNSQVAHQQLLEKRRQGRIDVYFLGDSITRRWGTSDEKYQPLLAKARTGGIDLYFLGDSITRRWGALDYPDFLAHWNRTFRGWNPANFGWGGDRTENILWRLENGELDGVNPKVIVVLAGTNNVGKEPGDPARIADVTRGVKAIVDTCRRKAPAATVVLTAIFPRNDNRAVVPTIERINANLAGMADGKSVRFLDVNPRLADANGVIFEGMMVDGLHPALKGYEIWAAGLEPILTELLGPPK